MTLPPRGRVRLLARLLWMGVVLFILGLFVAALPIRYAQLLTLSTLPPEIDPATVQASLAGVGLSLAAYATYVIAIQIVVVVGFVAVAGVIFWRTGADWLAVFVSLMLVAIGVNPDTTALGQINPLWGAVGEFVGDTAWAALVIFFYIFPDGRFRPGWTRLVALGVVALQAGSTLFPAAPVNLDTWPPAARSLLLMLLFGIGLFAQIYRYRRLSNPVQRQQTKWVVFGSTAAILLLIGLGIPATLLPSLAADSPYGLMIEPGIPLVLLLIPMSLAMAILRAGLWEIDLIINRTLVYGTLTGMLLAVYLISVVLLQGLFRALTGQESNLTIVVATLTSAALFQPLRGRLQGFIDRRFYRRKYDAARTLAAFSVMLRDELDLACLADELVAVVDETMQPRHLSLWLRRPAGAGRPEPRLRAGAPR